MLLVFSLCFIGCKPADNDPKVDIILDGKYFAEVIYNNPYISDPTNSSKITIENNKIYDHEFIEYELQGDFFVSTNDIYKDVFTPIKDIEKIWFAEIVMPDDVDAEIGFYLTLVNSNYYLYYANYSKDRGYYIKYAYKLIRVEDHLHEYVDGVCECGEFDDVWLNENFRLSDEKILYKGSVDAEFNCDVILLTLKHTTTYIELSKRHFGIDRITEVRYVTATPPSHFYEPGNEDKLDNFNQIVFLYVDVETKEEIIELIKELEKLPFIRSAEPNYIEHTC